MFFALFFRAKSKDKDKEASEFIDEGDDPMGLDEDEEYLHNQQVESPFADRSVTMRANRLEQGEVAWARERRLKEMQMWSIVREFFAYMAFLSLLFLLAYSNGNPNAFYQVQHLRNTFHNSRQINTIDQYWNWLEHSFVTKLRAQSWYNGQAPRNLSGFLDDKTHRLIGWATMRQLRVRSDSCHVGKSLQTMFSLCEDEYSFFNEEKRSFERGWGNVTEQAPNASSVDRAFTYQSSEQLGTQWLGGNHHTYGSGGYVYDFRGRLQDLKSNLSQLHQANWIDGQTRAVIVQFTLYNPNVQLFTSVILLAEFLTTGGIETQFSFQPISFQSKPLSAHLAQSLSL